MPAPSYHPHGDPFLRAHWLDLIIIFLLVVVIIKLG
jgi:hypothetical protein